VIDNTPRPGIAPGGTRRGGSEGVEVAILCERERKQPEPPQPPDRPDKVSRRETMGDRFTTA